MPRRKTDSKLIEGVLYYTANHFASTVYCHERTARNFLSKYEHLESSKNPKLYLDSVMETAIYDFLNVRTPEELEQSIEQARAEQELKEFQGRMYSSQNETEYNVDEVYSNKAKNESEERFDKEITIMLLKHLLSLHGFSFDEERYKEDLYLDCLAKQYLVPGDERVKQYRAVLKRLSSSNSYLIEDDKLKPKL